MHQQEGTKKVLFYEIRHRIQNKWLQIFLMFFKHQSRTSAAKVSKEREMESSKGVNKRKDSSGRTVHSAQKLYALAGVKGQPVTFVYSCKGQLKGRTDSFSCQLRQENLGNTVRSVASAILATITHNIPPSILAPVFHTALHILLSVPIHPFILWLLCQWDKGFVTPSEDVLAPAQLSLFFLVFVCLEVVVRVML